MVQVANSLNVAGFCKFSDIVPVDMFFYDTGIYGYEAQLKDETPKKAARLKEQEKESEEERQYVWMKKSRS